MLCNFNNFATETKKLMLKIFLVGEKKHDFTTSNTLQCQALSTLHLNFIT